MTSAMEWLKALPAATPFNYPASLDSDWVEVWDPLIAVFDPGSPTSAEFAEVRARIPILDCWSGVRGPSNRRCLRSLGRDEWKEPCGTGALGCGSVRCSGFPGDWQLTATDHWQLLRWNEASALCLGRDLYQCTSPFVPNKLP